MALQAPNIGLDRRGCGRIHHQGEVLVKGLSSTFGRGQTRDVNESGARLLVQEKVKPGHDLVLHLKLEAQRALSFLATVVWTRSTEQGTEVGVRFQDGCQADRRRLNRWLQHRRLLSFA
ncbi:PilZ domain-containing protein [bacterium]|nr:PilZ domain-containing protein [bacterium]